MAGSVAQSRVAILADVRDSPSILNVYERPGFNNPSKARGIKVRH
jgi:hypothetical protein